MKRLFKQSLFLLLMLLISCETPEEESHDYLKNERIDSAYLQTKVIAPLTIKINFKIPEIPNISNQSLMNYLFSFVVKESSYEKLLTSSCFISALYRPQSQDFLFTETYFSAQEWFNSFPISTIEGCTDTTCSPSQRYNLIQFYNSDQKYLPLKPIQQQYYLVISFSPLYHNAVLRMRQGFEEEGHFKNIFYATDTHLST